ncbi:histidine phosphatase family protein [Aneurinibacillus terranovensis]|uniref:histidine phosphatase family protein n=1 Tax=Aneurinibacillus terranovensis TaxID=278991 RepID=UPI000422F534|nr:histidine phosphatase family protein [Aneurinibacillus terranovensis]
MRWIWVRHGQTDRNVRGCYLGHLNPPLNEEGNRQAQAAANRLLGVKIDCIYASDLARCMQTASMIGEHHGLNPVPVPALRELHFGEWDGRTYNEVMETDGTRLMEWYNHPYDVCTPGGESLMDMGRRIDLWLKSVMDLTSHGETAVLVSHGGPIRWFQSQWLSRKPYSFWEVSGLRHGEILIVEWDGNRWVAGD